MAREDMNYWRFEPDARLRPWVLCYWMVEPAPGEAARRAAGTDDHQLLIPDGHSELVFHLAGSFTRWHVTEPQRRARICASYLIGGRTQSVVTQSAGGLRLAGVKLDPRALRVLLRRPLTEFRDNTVACADLACPALMDLEDAIANVSSPAHFVLVLDRFFLRRLSDEVQDESTVHSLVQRIRTTRGSQSILRWASAHGIELRTLERRFIARMGMTPKQYARVLRFKHSYRELANRKPDTRKSHLDPYYDESHFNREFRHFLGATPNIWFEHAGSARTTVGDHLLDGEFGSH